MVTLHLLPWDGEMSLTEELLALCTGASEERASIALIGASRAMSLYGIDQTANRAGMFLANVGHETGNLKFYVELWGPTDAQSRYDSRKDLGNKFLGDGFKYRGRGWLQTTGRGNYAQLTLRLRERWPTLQVPDFVAYPDLLASPEWAAISAADYWSMAQCEKFADVGDFDGVCDLINRGHKTSAYGDTNGFKDRLTLWNAAKPALILAGFPTDVPSTLGVR